MENKVKDEDIQTSESRTLAFDKLMEDCGNRPDRFFKALIRMNKNRRRYEEDENDEF